MSRVYSIDNYQHVVMGNIIDRLEALMEHYKLNNNSLTVKADLSVGLLGQARDERKGRKGLHSATIQKILAAFPEVSPAWLLIGEGAMLRSGGHPAVTADPVLPEGNIIALRSKVAAGLLKHHGQQEFLADQPRMMLPGPQFRGAGLLAIQVEGPSMEPTILHGDWLVVRQLHDPRQEVRPGQVYVVVTRDGALAKRLYPDLVGQSIACRSDNPEHLDVIIKDTRPLVYDVLALLRENLGDQRPSIGARLLRLEHDVAKLKKS